MRERKKRRKKERALRYQLAELKIKSDDEGRVSHYGGTAPIKKATFDGKNHQVERYLAQFERLARSCRVPRDSWAIQLSGLRDRQ